eukprot:GHVR01134402.1.p2 GENE.GHVR01134402.1~~GHVR01134402.1.p2  ORF type:complete len:121 (-),score=82.49 GHVR01134402.1:633-995(-)
MGRRCLMLLYVLDNTHTHTHTPSLVPIDFAGNSTCGGLVVASSPLISSIVHRVTATAINNRTISQNYLNMIDNTHTHTHISLDTHTHDFQENNQIRQDSSQEFTHTHTHTHTLKYGNRHC